MPRPTIASCAAELLAAHGPLPLTQLTELVVERGMTKARDPQAAVSSAVRNSMEFTELQGRRWAHVPTLVAHSLFTHRLTEEELDQGHLVTWPDLAPLTLPPRQTLRSNLGDLQLILDSPHRWRERPLAGPSGWLAGFSAGDVVAVRRDGDRLELMPADDRLPAPFVDKRLRDEASRMLALLEREPGVIPPVIPLSRLVHELLADASQAFDLPGRPLGERFTAAGFDVHESLVGRPGTDWSLWDLDALWEDDDDPREDELLDQDLERMFGLDPGSVEAARLLLDGAASYAELRQQPSRADLDKWAVAISYREVSSALAQLAHALDDTEELGELCRRVADVSHGRVRAASLVVVAACDEALGRDVEAEAMLQQALAADPDHEAGLLTAARYADDRGDAARAVQLLRRARVAPDDSRLTRLRRFAEPPDTGVSRNAPCPCGSGRKHKACCLPGARHPLHIRAHWLRDKLVQWALEPAQRQDWFDYAQAIAPDDESQWVVRCLVDALLQDLGIWGSELVEDFAECRGPLLPADERDLLDAWVTVRPRLWEVVDTNPQRNMTLRDVDRDDQVMITERTISKDVTPGQLLLTRVLPDGEGGAITGGVAMIPRQARARLVELLRSDREDLDLTVAEWLGAASRPPELHTSDSHEVVLCTGRWQVADPISVAQALAEELGPLEAGQVVLLDGDTVIAELTLDGRDLVASALSRARWTRVEELVGRAAPGALLMTSDELPASAVLSGDVTPLRRRSPTGEIPPEMHALLQARMEAYERAWVDEPVPALGDLTPRAALDDPQRRRDLLTLLDDFDTHGPPASDAVAMSADRIRRLLGLDIVT